MKHTIKNVLSHHLMKDCRVRTAIDFLDSILVEGISVIEVPVENFVRRNELVLTTTIGCGHSPTLFTNYVKEIIDSKAAGLMVATGMYIKEIPQEVIEIAEKEKFPIIEVPWELRFSDITQVVMEGLENWQLSVLKKAEEMQKNLLNLFMRGAHLSAFAKFIQDEIGTPTIVINKKGTVYGHSPHARSIAKEWTKYCFSHTHNFSFHSLLQKLTNTTIRSFSFEPYKVLQLSIGHQGNVQGYMLLFLDSEDEMEAFLNDSRTRLLEYAASMAILWFQKESVVLETEMRLRGDFVWSLANGDIDSWDNVLSRAKSFYYNIDLPYVCILGYPENLTDIFKNQKQPYIDFDVWLTGTIEYIEEQILLAAKELKRKVMITYHRDLFILFYEIEEEQLSAQINAFIDQVEQQLSVLKGLTMSWGIGENQAGVRTFAESYKEAKLAFDIGQHQRKPGHRSTFKNTSQYRLLLSIAKNEETMTILKSVMAPLVNHDGHKEMELVNTLIHYVQYNGNVSQTSRAMNLHRQSLLYRLKKIETITGLSLQDSDDLMLLYLGAKLKTMGFIRNS